MRLQTRTDPKRNGSKRARSVEVLPRVDFGYTNTGEFFKDKLGEDRTMSHA